MALLNEWLVHVSFLIQDICSPEREKTLFSFPFVNVITIIVNAVKASSLIRKTYLKGSYDAFLKIIILCIWGSRIC